MTTICYVVTQKNADIFSIIIISFSVILIVMNYSIFSLNNGLKIFPVTTCSKKKVPKRY